MSAKRMDSAPLVGASRPSPRYLGVRFWHVLTVTWIAYTAYNIGRRPFAVSRSAIAADLGISKQESSMVDSSFLLMYTIGQLFYVSIKRRWSSRTILVAGLVGSACCSVALARSSSVYLFSLAWGMNGAFQAAGWASCLSILTPWLTAGERGMVMGVWGTNMAAGGVAGNSLVSWGIGHLGSWREATLLTAAVLLLCAAIVALFLQAHPNSAGFVAPSQSALARELRLSDQEFLSHPNAIRTKDGELLLDHLLADKTASGPNVEEHKAALTFMQTALLPGVAAIAFSYCFHKLSRYALMFWLPFYFSRELGYKSETAGYLSSALDVGGLAGSIASGVLADFIARGTRRALTCCILSAGMIGSLLVFALTKSTLSASATAAGTAAFMCGFFAFGIDSLMTGSMLQDYADRIHMSAQIGAISGFVGGVGTAGSILQGFLAASVSDASWDALFSLLAILTAVACLLLWKPLVLEHHAARERGPLNPGAV